MDGASPQTIPVTEGALLAEESTIDPLSPLPSFLELTFVESTASSGRAALSSSFEAVISNLSATVSAASSSSVAGTTSFVESYKLKAYSFLLRLFQQYAPEIRAFIIYTIERSFLHSAVRSTAAESVYGLRRARLVAGDSGGGPSNINSDNKMGTSMLIRPITKADGTRSALLAALAPYIKERLDLLYSRERDRLNSVASGENDNRTHQRQPQLECNANVNHSRDASISDVTDTFSLHERFRKLFIATYPFLHMTHEGTVLAYRFAYLIGKSVYYGPSLHVLGLVLRRVTQADLSQHPNSATSTADKSKKSSRKNNTKAKTKSAKMEKSLQKAKTIAITIAATALVVGWIASYREEIRRRRRRWIAGSVTNNISSSVDGENVRDNSGSNISSSPTVPPIPPPQPPKLLSSIQKLPRDKSLCPLCKRQRVNPVASTSGYVFCHRCLVMHLREHGNRCPLTGINCSESRIIRIYEPTDQGMNQHRRAE